MKMLQELLTFRLSPIQSGFPAVARQSSLHAVVAAVLEVVGSVSETDRGRVGASVQESRCHGRPQRAVRNLTEISRSMTAGIQFPIGGAAVAAAVLSSGNS